MKKYLSFFLTLALAGCQVVDFEPDPFDRDFTPGESSQPGLAVTDGGLDVIIASSENAGTRTSLRGLDVVWDEGDAVSVFRGTPSLDQGVTFRVAEGCGGSAVATLVSDTQSTGAGLTGLDIAVYGDLAKDFSVSGTTVMASFDLDSLRHYRPGSFGREDMPMMAVSEPGSGTFSFKNLFGALELKVSGDGTEVKSITVRGNKGEALSGHMTFLWSSDSPVLMPGSYAGAGKKLALDCGEGVTLSKDSLTTFYITLPPITFPSGLTVDIVTSGGTVTKSTGSVVSVTRNRIVPFAAIVLNGWEDEFATFATRYKFVEQSHSSITPMGTHFENLKAATEKQKVWLADPANEPYRYIMRNRADTTWTLTPKTVNFAPYGRPCPADVVQHNIGNCVCLSVFAALSQSYPSFIEHIITRNADGTFTVRMYDAMGNPLDVGLTSKFFTGPAGGTPGATGHNGVFTWASVMEKALMKYESCLGYDYVDGIDPLPALAPFVGNGTSHKFAMKQVPQADMKHVVEVCLRTGHIMTGGFRTAGMVIGTAKTVTLHEYACLLCPDPSYLFTMRNPWGFCTGGTKRGDGCMDIYWDDELFPKNIYLRILDPGAAEPYFVGAENLQPYQKPF